jgi:hypothetical protein
VSDQQLNPVTMTEDEFIDHCLANMMNGWVPLRVYLRMYPTETEGKVHTRVKRGVWTRRVHYAAPKGGSPWVNLPKVREWIEADEGAGSRTGQ